MPPVKSGKGVAGFILNLPPPPGDKVWPLGKVTGTAIRRIVDVDIYKVTKLSSVQVYPRILNCVHTRETSRGRDVYL